MQSLRWLEILWAVHWLWLAYNIAHDFHKMKNLAGPLFCTLVTPLALAFWHPALMAFLKPVAPFMLGASFLVLAIGAYRPLLSAYRSLPDNPRLSPGENRTAHALSIVTTVAHFVPTLLLAVLGCISLTK